MLSAVAVMAIPRDRNLTDDEAPPIQTVEPLLLLRLCTALQGRTVKETHEIQRTPFLNPNE